MIELTSLGKILIRPPRNLAALRKEFKHCHCVRLRKFLGPCFLKRLRGEIERSRFVEKRHQTHATPERFTRRGPAMALALFVLNDPRVFEILEAITQFRPLFSFGGRVYRMRSDRLHHIGWHTDADGYRRVGVTVNLSPCLYSGGVFSIRNRKDGRVYGEIANTGRGDALVFRIHPDLEHRTTDVTGAGEKMSLAGWFLGKRLPHYPIMYQYQEQ